MASLARAARTTVCRIASPMKNVSAASRCMSSLHDRERAMEKAYFNKEDEKLMRSLLKKMKSQAEAEKTDAASAAIADEGTALDSIISKYSMSATDREALLNWRHSHDF